MSQEARAVLRQRMAIDGMICLVAGNLAYFSFQLHRPSMTNQDIPGIHEVNYDAWQVQAEQGGYFYLCKVGVWIEFRVRDARFTDRQFGARWSIDNWASHHDTLAFRKHRGNDENEIWRIEIKDVITTGWRDGTIGGPNGEQPSSNRWTLWGKDKGSVKCLPLGTVPPLFEFALYLKHQETVYWENNQGRNFSLSLNNFF